jgi:hypothetical protein
MSGDWRMLPFSEPLPAAKCQCTGIPIWYTVFPITLRGRIRFVTMATPTTSPRFDRTLTLPPLVIPFSSASSFGSSTKKSGMASTRYGTCWVTKCSCSVTR